VIQTLRLRLTLWHASFFGALALVVFVIAYYMVSHQLLHAIDVDLQDTAQEFAERLKVGGTIALKKEIDSETASHGENMFFARLLDEKARTRIEQLSRTWAFPIPQPDQSKQNMQWFDVGTDMRGGPARLLALPIPGSGWIEVGLSLTEYEAQMHQMRTVFALSLLVMVLLGVFVGWLQLRTVFRSVEQVRHAAIGISEGELNHRVELKGQGQELSDLANAFNTMLDRIQLLIGEMRDVSDHIAHDLRTPVSRIRGLAETSLIKNKNVPSSQAEALATIVEEAEQLGEMINTMLEITQTDAGLIDQQQECVGLAALLHEVHDFFLPAAEDAGISFSIDLPDQHLQVLGNRMRLQRAISSLIDNSLKFSDEGGQVSLTTEIAGDVLLVHIRDEGIGISTEDMDHIFERFYRSDQSRNKLGNGLGLSYAMSIIRSHGGNIEVESSIGIGSTFTIRLPLEKL